MKHYIELASENFWIGEIKDRMKYMEINPMKRTDNT